MIAGVVNDAAFGIDQPLTATTAGSGIERSNIAFVIGLTTGEQSFVVVEAVTANAVSLFG